MEFIATNLPGVVLIKPKVHGDARGFFIESYKKSIFMQNGISYLSMICNLWITAYAVITLLIRKISFYIFK